VSVCVSNASRIQLTGSSVKRGIMISTAWIVEWERTGSQRPIPRQELFVLPWRWRSSRVIDFMRCIYFNSPQFSLENVLSDMNVGKSNRVRIIDEVRRIIYGDNPFLVAAYVRDLRIEREHACRIEHISWTRPAGWQSDYELKRLKVIGAPRLRTFKRTLQSTGRF
jgi:hypothetical protein